MKKLILIISIIVIASLAIAYWYFSDRGRFTTAPEFTGLSRIVSGNDLTSKYDPSAILRFDSIFHHIGGQKFILYGVADTEQHFFIETTNDNKLKSVFWIQYEAYLPGRRNTYNYDDSPLRVTLGDYEFYTDTDEVEYDPSRKRSKGTDGAMARQFLASKGYSLPKDFAYARLVYLTDDSNKKELMIIFIDDLLTQGLTASDLKDIGAFTARWSEVEQSHLDRVRNTLTVLPLDISN